MPSAWYHTIARTADTAARYAHAVTQQDAPNPGLRGRLTRWRLRDPRVTANARDDRGRRVRLLDPALVRDSSALDTPNSPAAAARLAWARAEIRAGTLGTRIGLFALLSWVLVPILDGSKAPPAVWLTVLPLWAALLWQLNRLIARRGNARRTRRVAGVLASHGLCPTCAYSLADLTAEADGCTVCPECGGAWRRGTAGSNRQASLGAEQHRWWGWGRVAAVLDDRRETHAAVRPKPDALYTLPWTAAQSARLQAAMREARDATRRGRRWMAAMQFGVGTLQVGVAAYAGWVAGIILRDTNFGSYRLEILSVGGGMVAFWMAIGVLQFVTGVRILGGRWWLAGRKGYACLPRHGFCAACFHDLTGLAPDPDPDDCTVCPGCGAAWKVAQAAPPAIPAPPDGNPAAHGPDPR